MATGAGIFVCGASGGALDADGCDDAGPSGTGVNTDASPRLFVPATRGAMIAFSTLAALDLTVVGRRVRKPALECVPLVARQRVADHSEPRIASRGCAIGPRIISRAAMTSARSISDLPPFRAKA